MSDERRAAGFKERTRLDAARERLLDAVSPHDRTESVPVGDADGRVLAEAVTAERPVPHFERAAADGYAVRAEDTSGASDRSPAVLAAAEAVGPGTAVPVRAGGRLPDGADAVATVERVDARGDDLEVGETVTPGENVTPVGGDATAGESVVERGRRLRPADLAACAAVGRETVTVSGRPVVAVVPTGDELVAADPGPGEAVETDGLAVSRYVERWGGRARRRDAVSDDPSAIRDAVERDLDADVVVTTGGSSVGECDLVPDVVADLGALPVHGVAIEPGESVGVGVVDDTPVLALPGPPVSSLVAAVQLLRPAVGRAGGRATPDFPTTSAALARKVASAPGVRHFVRVDLDREGHSRVDGDRGPPNGGDRGPANGDDRGTTSGGDRIPANGGDAAGRALAEAETAERPRATPVGTRGPSALSAVARTDGWLVVPESREGVDAGAVVDVQRWEWSA